MVCPLFFPLANKTWSVPYFSNTGELEKSDVYYDEYGRQIGRTDYTDHGYPDDHTDPHHTITEYGPGYSNTGKQTGPFPGEYGK